MKVKPRTPLRIIAGEDRGRRLISPVDDRIRPTPGMAREAIANILQDILPGCDFLDLYAGHGAVGLEALSRGAKTVTFVEQNREAFQILRENVRQMTRGKDCHLVPGSVIDQCRQFARQQKRFDVIFIDAPYDIEGIPLRLVDPLLTADGIVMVQRPVKYAVGDPFRGTRLEEYDCRRYGKAEILFFRFPIPSLEKEEE
jgi:16S rRNA (guanine(966)-N(2))-methyltransferase RsmD